MSAFYFCASSQNYSELVGKHFGEKGCAEKYLHCSQNTFNKPEKVWRSVQKQAFEMFKYVSGESMTTEIFSTSYSHSTDLQLHYNQRQKITVHLVHRQIDYASFLFIFLLSIILRLDMQVRQAIRKKD